jgi:hypothetical protein
MILIDEPEPVGTLSEAEVREQLSGAANLVRELLVAWAEYETSEKVGRRQDHVREARRMWGRFARRVAGAGTYHSTVRLEAIRRESP